MPRTGIFTGERAVTSVAGCARLWTAMGSARSVIDALADRKGLLRGIKRLDPQMRARAAYISSLGTTGILVASALLMLGMVSAIVAFNGWPAGAVGAGVESGPLQATHPARGVSVAPRAPSH